MFKKFRFLWKDMFKQFNETDRLMKSYQEEIVELNKELKENEKQEEGIKEDIQKITNTITEIKMPKRREVEYKDRYELLGKLEKIKTEKGEDALQIFKKSLPSIPEMFFKSNTSKLKDGEIDNNFKSNFSKQKWKEVENTIKQYNENIFGVMFLIVNHSMDSNSAEIKEESNQDIAQELKDRMGEEKWKNMVDALESKGESLDQIIKK